MLFFTHALISLSWAWLFQIYWSELYPCRYGLISRLLISRISRYICWRIICFFDIFSTLASISNFTAISIERCYVISRPFTYVNDSSVQNIYIYSMAGGSDHGGSLANANIDNAKKSICSLRFHCQLRVTKYFDTGNVHKDLPNCKFAGSQNAGLDTAKAVACKVREERKVALTVSILTGFFLMAWSPFFFISMLAEFSAGCLPKGGGMTALVIFVKWMHYSNSAVNPNKREKAMKIIDRTHENFLL